MRTRPVVLAILAAAGLAACIPGLPSTPSAAPLPATGFSDVDTLPDGTPVGAPAGPAAGGPTTPGGAAPSGPATPGTVPAASPTPVADVTPFTDPRFVDVKTTTKFTPVVLFGFDGLKAGGEPAVSSDVYQTSDELEVREVRTLLEGTRFRYDRLQVGGRVGGGQMDIGTPPKLTLAVTVACTDTDKQTYGVFSVKAANALVELYLADIRVKDNDGNLSIVSVANYARANDAEGRATTERSARVVQRFDAGYVVLPDAGSMRMRVLTYSETDPAGGGTAMRVQRQMLGLSR